MQNKIKVCILTTSFPSYEGDYKGIFIYKLAKELTKNNVEIELIYPYNKNIKNENINGIKIKRFKYFVRRIQTLTEESLQEGLKTFYGKLQFPFFCFFFYLKIISNARKSEIIHANWMPTAFLALMSKLFHRKKIILTERSSYLISTNNPVWKFFNNFTFKRVDELITISEYSKNIIEKKYRIKNVKVIPNGIENIIKKDRKKLRKKLRISLNDKVFLFVGRIAEIKGLNYLLESFLKLNKKYKNIQLIIIGEGEELNNLLNYSKKNKMTNVHFLGKKEHKIVFDYMQASDIFIFPSLNETGGNVLLEARSCGLPIVSTKVGWAEEIINEVKNGLFINKKDPKSIYEKISLILENKKISKIISDNSKKFNLPTWKNCALQYKSIYEKIYKQ